MVDQGEIAVALTIAGSDSSAGAGIQADLKTFSAFGVYGLTALTCVVAEIPGKVRRIQGVDEDVVAEQVDLLFANFPVGAIKTGLLYSGEIVARVAAFLREAQSRNGRAIPLVIDPVMVATSGDLLLPAEAIAVYERELFQLASLITPNLDEAATLLDCEIPDLPAMHDAGKRLVGRYGVPILLKGGHLGGKNAIDLLFADDVVRELRAPFVRNVQTHGTGCTYSAAITAGLSAGITLEDAVTRAKQYVSAAIAQHFTWGAASSPLHALNHSANVS
ncbi:MAG: bifunctional hydroxymethylpyrimidine kinase/phosphomethylpyrimidine kinase [Chthoniobacterales bacterium]|jgi:hydroxymethylpyrimidine/phosphomethylpyrimidine kinase|nr:bifunctional hydroxymethylpyrimidine kinase/phosphomethylpyrimidine kinase [Chthoniobacterales bacterium]